VQRRKAASGTALFEAAVSFRMMPRRHTSS
jgi:hypothetical protein